MEEGHRKSTIEAGCARDLRKAKARYFIPRYAKHKTQYIGFAVWELYDYINGFLKRMDHFFRLDNKLGEKSIFELIAEIFTQAERGKYSWQEVKTAFYNYSR